MGRFKYIVWLHLKVGYVVGTFFPPLFLSVLVGIDVIRLWMANSNPIVGLAGKYEWAWVANGVILIIFLLVVLPVAFAPWIAASTGRHRITRICRHRSGPSIVIYIILCVILGYCVVFSHNLELLAGDSYVEGRFKPAFNSIFLKIVEGFPIVIWHLFAALSVILEVISNVCRWRPQKSVDWSAHVSRLELSAMPSRFAPQHGRFQLNLDSGRIAPLLEGIHKEWAAMLLRYQKLVPGSCDAARHLKAAWFEVKGLLTYFGIKEQAGRQIRLAASTGRSLEIAFRELCQGSCILLSPYEHPTEHIVAQVDHRIKGMPVNSRFFDKPWAEQKKDIVQWVETQLNPKRPPKHYGSTAFVISEVCWCTGRHIQIEELINAIKDRIGKNLTVIIDGAHAVGNLVGGRPVELGDAYVFSGHKWLLAPEPCGLVITRNTVNMYDVWVGELPDTTVGAAQVCGLLASLRFLRSVPEDYRAQRSENLRNYLRKELNGTFDLVGEGSGLKETNLVSIRPAQDYRWNVSADEFIRRLLEKNIHVCVVKLPLGTKNSTREFWIRLSIAWFLDWRAIRNVTRFFRKSIKKATSS